MQHFQPSGKINVCLIKAQNLQFLENTFGEPEPVESVIFSKLNQFFRLEYGVCKLILSLKMYV